MFSFELFSYHLGFALGKYYPKILPKIHAPFHITKSKLFMQGNKFLLAAGVSH